MNKSDKASLSFSLKYKDEKRRIIYGAVYTPNQVDGKGYFMEPEEVEAMCHRYLRIDVKNSIDTNHDNIPNGCFPVESYIAKANDPNYSEGTWVIGVKVANSAIWDKIIGGDLNAFSMEILVTKKPAMITYTTIPSMSGSTEVYKENEDDEGHQHLFFVELDSMGRVIKGKTNTVNGHYHDIVVNSITKDSENHSHRLFIHR